jgi:hypothetical protein
MTKMSEPYWKEFDSFTISRIGTNYDVAAFEKYECLCSAICLHYRGYALCINPVTMLDDPATRIIAVMDAIDAEIAAIAAKATEAAAKVAEPAATVVNHITTEIDLYAD